MGGGRVKALIQYDNLDDRKEIHRLLQILHPATAVRWLDRQCQKVSGPHGSRPGPSLKMRPRVEAAITYGGERHYRLATEIYLDLWVLASQYGLDLGAATKELEALARQQ
jgi:hypothetical protein